MERFHLQRQNVDRRGLQVKHLKGGYYLWHSFQYTAQYAHWLTQHAPKVADYTRLDADLNGSLRIALPCYGATPLALELLRLLGLDKIEVLEEGHIYRFDQLHLTSYYKVMAASPALRWTVRTLRARLAPFGLVHASGLHRRRIYLERERHCTSDDCSRGFALRTARNEDSMVSMLRTDFNFSVERFGNLSFVQKAARLRDAAVAVTQTGANMFNLLFADPTPCACIWLGVGRVSVPPIGALMRYIWPENKRMLESTLADASMRNSFRANQTNVATLNLKALRNQVARALSACT